MMRNAYRLHGRFAAEQTFEVPEELAMRKEPAPAVELPRWHSIALFLFMGIAALFAMCAIGRPGA